MTDTPKTVSRSSFAFLSGTLLSRFSGLGRDMSMAFCFGSRPEVAAFMVAFRFANLLRRLLGEGPLASGFIPYFEQARQDSAGEGARFFRDVLGTLCFFLLGLIAFVELTFYGLWYFGGFFEAHFEILHLTLLMFPGLLFISLFGIGSGLLQCEKKFFVTGIAPIGFNLVWMGAVFAFKDLPPKEAMVHLSSAVVLGFALQWMMLFPELFRFFKRSNITWKTLFSFSFFSPRMKEMIKPLLFSLLGVGAVQINAALDALFARISSLEGPAYLWYAIRLQQLPLALFGIALASALLPPLTRKIAQNQTEGYLELIRFALKRSFALMVPCTFGLLCLGALALNLVYGRGDFTESATVATYLCLAGYGVGLLPSVFVLILAPCFYAKKDYKTPMKGSLFAVLLNSGLSLFFVLGLHLGPWSIALATSLSAFCNYSFLAKKLKKEWGPLWDRPLLYDCFKTTLCVVIAALITTAATGFLGIDPTYLIWKGEAVHFPRLFSEQALALVAGSLLFGLSLFAYAWMLGAETLLGLVGIQKRVPVEEKLD